MKFLKFFAVAVLFAVATNASAQFTNASSKSSSTSVNTGGWSTLWVEWNPSSFNVDVKGADDESFTGFSLGYSRAISVTSSLPLFVEAGLGLQYSFDTKDLGEEYGIEDYYEYVDPKEKYSMLSAKVPVSLIYAFQIPNTSVALLPFAGIDLRYNIFGKKKTEWNLSGEFEDYLEDYYGKDYFSDEDCDLFDEKDMNKNEWKRFQIGWHIGLKARFNDKFMIGASYGTDFSEISKKTKIATGSITLGYTF